MSTILVLLRVAALWLLVAIPVALLIGRALGQASACCPHSEGETPDDDGWLDDAPAEVLQGAALRRRFAEVIADIPGARA